MDWRQRFEEHRVAMQPGDVIAFGGSGMMSRLISAASGSTVSHAAMISRAGVNGTGPMLLESTYRDGQVAALRGVGEHRFEDVLDVYQGNVWWLPLKAGVPRVPPGFLNDAFERVLHEMVGRPFDEVWGPMSVFSDLWDRMSSVEEGFFAEDTDRFFCSEIVIYALEQAGVLRDVHFSRHSPKDLCEWNIYDGRCIQLKGDQAVAIPRFNSADPPNDSLEDAPEGDPAEIIVKALLKAKALRSLDKLRGILRP